ncbi:hypothetical protein AAZX31_06G201800 [Glycine max]|uniref:F-box domain-containing protein n=1 Tax=Glycine soja TaxID=3848 RepID=A0A445KCQ7_GLYSO|nr:uncharacterized protein LOC114416697 [Glycine soja]KAG5032368.1 hypothetical protein JHK85_016350 [Glycine max]KAG5020041.1 hypothetical protein JHK87_015896 [Glycine soja]KAG5046572.1 hypothetical protein JHK86_015978 [Glycine max]KAG5149071.1 hypothetical protein JHK82_015952 [Glycine max]KAH1246696.1 hypothetical protein GmHk_06G016724 [Glycine max]
MDDHRNSTTKNAIGLCLLPQELIQNIFLSLVLPEIIRLKLLNKSFSRIISDNTFVRQYNSLSTSTTWLFVYKKRWLRDAALHSFTDRSSDRWFRIPISELLKPIQFHGEDLYFLAASNNVFLFASNTVREVVAVNLISVTVKKIPPSPLGPRGTSSWRRSGMKLVTDPTGSGHFRFMFAEFVDNRPVLFVYESRTDTWRSTEAEENTNTNEFSFSFSPRGAGHVFLNVVHGPMESVLVATMPDECDKSVVLRPRFNVAGANDDLTVGFSWGNVMDMLHVYGDGYMMVVKSEGGNTRNVRVLKRVELWGLSLDGRKWEFVSAVPGVIEKPYAAMMGCLEEKNGVVRAALVSNCEGVWDMTWLSFDTKWNRWTWMPLPDCKMKGWNMAGISFSSGLTLP